MLLKGQGAGQGGAKAFYQRTSDYFAPGAVQNASQRSSHLILAGTPVVEMLTIPSCKPGY